MPLCPEVVTVLKVLEAGRFRDKRVFAISGKWPDDVICRAFSALVKKAGLLDDTGKPKFTLHDLRRSFTTNLLISGCDVKSVQRLAGHSAIQTMLTYYAGTSAKVMAATVERMGRQVATS